MIRKAQSMGINVVIIAAIALLILVIIALLVSGAFGDLRDSTETCQVQGGVCVLPGDTPPSGYSPLEAPGCERSGGRCYAP